MSLCGVTGRHCPSPAVARAAAGGPPLCVTTVGAPLTSGMCHRAGSRVAVTELVRLVRVLTRRVANVRLILEGQKVAEE